jgi:hypothetical protein
VGTYPPRWPGGRRCVEVWFKQRRFYLGVVDGPEHGAAVVADVRAAMRTEEAEIPQPIVTRSRSSA